MENISTNEGTQNNIDVYLSEISELAPPLNGEFNSLEAFKKIKLSPDRGAAISEFKQNLSNQIEGMTCCRTLIENIIAQNPNVDANILFEILDKFAARYGVGGDQEILNY